MLGLQVLLSQGFCLMANINVRATSFIESTFMFNGQY